MLVIIATVRGVFSALEQPSSSTMKHFPAVVQTGQRISELVWRWREQFLSVTQLKEG